MNTKIKLILLLILNLEKNYQSDTEDPSGIPLSTLILINTVPACAIGTLLIGIVKGLELYDYIFCQRMHPEIYLKRIEKCLKDLDNKKFSNPEDREKTLISLTKKMKTTKERIAKKELEKQQKDTQNTFLKNPEPLSSKNSLSEKLNPKTEKSNENINEQNNQHPPFLPKNQTQNQSYNVTQLNQLYSSLPRSDLFMQHLKNNANRVFQAATETKPKLPRREYFEYDYNLFLD